MGRLVVWLAVMVGAMTQFPVFAQDAALGEKVFNKCRACHQIGEGAKTLFGPPLNGIVGRKAGSNQGEAY